jgi:hypothetical protein
MKTAPVTVTLLLIASGCIGLIAPGCSHQQDSPAQSGPAGANSDQAVTAIQNDSSKSPEQKVKEIDAIQSQRSGSQTVTHHKRSNDDSGPAFGSAGAAQQSQKNQAD